jgi:hypothetical protein
MIPSSPSVDKCDRCTTAREVPSVPLEMKALSLCRVLYADLTALARCKGVQSPQTCSLVKSNVDLAGLRVSRVLVQGQSE